MQVVEPIKCKLSVKIIITFIILLAGTLIGYIVYDEIKSVNETNEERKEQFNIKKEEIAQEEKIRKEKISTNENRIKEIDNEIDKLEEETRKYSDVNSKLFSVTRVREINDKKMDLTSEKNNLEQENFELNSIKNENVILKLEEINIGKIIFVPFGIGFTTLIVCIIVYHVGNKDAIKARNLKIKEIQMELARQKREQDMKRVKENIEAIGTTIGKTVANFAKEINPKYEALKCPNCGASLTGADLEVCKYCGSKLIKK